MSYILQTNSLEKIIYGEKVVSSLNIHINRGEIYGFLGPNGSGKTTVMKMLTNLWKPTKGTIEIFGEKLTPRSYKVLRRMGSIIEFPVFYEHLSGECNLQLHSEYMGYNSQRNIENVLDLLELSEVSKKPVRQYSLGMKQRLGIARAILTKPELLVLDEPMNGLDIMGIKHLRELFCMLRNELGVTIMMSTHIFSEIKDITDRVGIINRGKMVEEISMDGIFEKMDSYIDIRVEDIEKAAQQIRSVFRNDNFSIRDKNVIRVYDNIIKLQEIEKALILQGITIDFIEKKSESLEHYFLRLIGECEKNAKVN